MEIRAAGIKVAIASSSKKCLTVLERLDIMDLLDGIADGYSVVNTKPARIFLSTRQVQCRFPRRIAWELKMPTRASKP